MTDLTTLTAVKTQLNITGTLNDDLLSTYVTQASAMIETETARTFPGEPGTLYLDACAPYTYGDKVFFLTDVSSVTRVENDVNGTLNASQYRMLPPNGSPKYGIELLPSSGLSWSFDLNPQNAIKVIGNIGYGTIPPDIRLAATKLAAFLYQNRENTEQTVRFADGSSEIPANAPALVLRTLEKYASVRVYT